MSNLTLINQGPLAGTAQPETRLAHSISRTAQLLDCGRTTVYQLLAEGRLEAVKLGRSTLVLDSSIRALLDSLPRYAA
ncbi:helix-turn-helix domain-containing protein [Roseomonas sp. BN140053]|uniref:helix-turn-helix domain-containing protein n=1 Tax=Roseomonas sp. BN140053 TaxID=3391898 RepID=UPI0039E7A66B